MSRAYEPFCSSEPIIIRHGLSGKVQPNMSVSDPSEFKIGFSGGMYATRAWKSFQQALDLIEWKINCRNVVLVIASSNVQLDAKVPANVRFYGWRSLQETAALMRDCDMLYLPQAFSVDKRTLTELSFPTKLSTYSNTGRPVFLHTPRNGSLAVFGQENDFGLMCHSTHPRDIAECLRKITDRPQILAEQSDRTATIGNEILTQQAFASQLKQFLA